MCDECRLHVRNTPRNFVTPPLSGAGGGRHFPKERVFCMPTPTSAMISVLVRQQFSLSPQIKKPRIIPVPSTLAVYLCFAIEICESRNTCYFVVSGLPIAQIFSVFYVAPVGCLVFYNVYNG